MGVERTGNVCHSTELRGSYCEVDKVPILLQITGVLAHGSFRCHSIELFESLSVLLHRFTARLIVPGKHPAKHHEVSAGSECL